MRKFLKIIVVALLLLSLLPITVNAQSGVEITYAGQVADSITYNGITVNAIYAPYTSISNYGSNTTYCCAAFVNKFYSSVYGINVYNLVRNGGGPLISGGGGSFSKVSSPQIGDIVHYLAGKTTHWSIVKSIGGNTITVIEQNGWNNKEYEPRTHARIGHTYNIADPNVTFYHYNNANAGSQIQPDYIGYITGTSGALAINSKPASGNQIGRIPEGESCTVYPSRSSGMWYWVEYADISGYAYGKYISRTAPVQTNPLPTITDPVVTKLQAPTLTISSSKIETTGSVTLSWNQIENATEYTLSKENIERTKALNTETTGTEIIIANLNAGVYKFKVCAHNSDGDSDYSNTVQLTVTEPRPTAPATPYIQITATSIEEGGSATISWDKDSNATKYTVTIRNTNTGREMEKVTTDTKLVLSGLAVGTYRITVFAENDTMCSPDISNSLQLTVTEEISTGSSTINPGPAVTGYVVGTNGALAINDKPAASPKNSTQIGRIPEGASCKVYPDMSSGKWYWVEYDGITGYASRSYISDTPPVTPSASPATTPSTAPAPEPTMVGYVSGTNGALAINDRPAASPNNSTQIGRIPEGASCTVYTNKGSGSWYWVEYNGITGYAYKSYISSTPPAAPVTPPVTTVPTVTPTPEVTPTVPAESTVIGYISGINGALAINDKSAASPKNSTQIGRIPEGASCTVYTSRGSGNWYWVEYNGVSGYAYSKYILL